MLLCPSCKFYFSNEEVAAGLSQCPACNNALDVLAFPALYRAQEKARRLLAQENDARCAFHADNQAETSCGQCGRLICSVCALPIGKQTLCPQCLNRSLHAEKASPSAKRIAWDTLALELVVHPLLLFLWWATFFTSTASLVISIIFFNKPFGPLPRGKWRFVLAIIVSIVWIGLWIIGLYLFINKVMPNMHGNLKKS